MTPIRLVVNPVAGKGAGARILPRLESELTSRGITYSISKTGAPGEATLLARQAPEDIIVAVGGDGTIHEVANGLVGSGKTVGIIPCGSGNDLIKSVGIPRGLSDAVSLLERDFRRKMDVGVVRCGKYGNFHEEYFVNGVGIGFDATVARRTRDIKFLSGTALYLLAVLQTLRSYTSPLLRLSNNGTVDSRRQLLIAIGNGRCAGGGFYLTPSAQVDDGLLDVCRVDDLNLAEIAVLIPKVMVGKHIHSKGVTMFTTKGLELSSESQFYVHADGEIVGDLVDAVKVTILPGALSIVCGMA